MEAWEIISTQLGWRKSFEAGKPIDGEGKPIPWYTYPAIEFIRSLELSTCRVFEYGCGNSSLFWSARVAEVCAVESDLNWANIVREFKISNLTIISAQNKNDYIHAPFAGTQKFDIVIIDGKYRRECVLPAIKVASEAGIIIFDNSDWYPDACTTLRNNGWFQVDFSGLGPINPYQWTTSVFLRGNVDLKKSTTHKLIGGSAPVWREDD